MNTQKRTTSVPVNFEVEYEIHELKKFQDEGHFVPAIRQRDAKGNETMQPRPWKGKHVHALTLFGPGGNQILRALSDSRQEADRLLQSQIIANFWGAQKSLEIAEFNADQARKTKDERDRLVAWMVRNAKPEDLAQVLGIAEAAVDEFKRKEAELQADPRPITSLLAGGL